MQFESEQVAVATAVSDAFDSRCGLASLQKGPSGMPRAVAPTDVMSAQATVTLEWSTTLTLQRGPPILALVSPIALPLPLSELG